MNGGAWVLQCTWVGSEDGAFWARLKLETVSFSVASEN